MLCFGKVMGGSHVEGLVIATSYCETHMEGQAFRELHFGKFLDVLTSRGNSVR